MTAGVVLTPAAVSAVPGGVAMCTVRVRNTSSVVDSFTITVLGDSAGWATPMPAVLSLFPGADGEVTISFRPPRTPDLHAGPLDFAVRVVPTEDPDGSVVEEGTINVEPFLDFAARLTPRTAETKRHSRHTVAVDNNGNAPLTVDLAALDPDDQLVFELKPPTITVAPGHTAESHIKVAARHGFARGTDRHRPFQATVTPAGGGMPTTLDATLVQRAGLPRFLPALIAAAVVIALAAVLLPGMLKKHDGTIKLANTDATTTTAAPVDEPAASVDAAATEKAKAPVTTAAAKKSGSTAAAAAAGATAAAGAGSPTTAARTAVTDAPVNTTPDAAATKATLPKPKASLPTLVPSFEGDTDEEIWSITPDGATKRKLTNFPQPQWSVGAKFNYAGTLITFTHANGPTHVWIMNADGGNQHDATPTTCPGNCGQPAFSADGKRVAYMRETASGSNTYDIYQADVDAAGVASNHRPLVATGADEQYPAFAPDGRLAFQRNVGGTWKVVVFDGRADTTIATGQHPAWSPNNDKLLFSDGNEVFSSKGDGTGSPTNLSNASGSQEDWPAFSPDGTKVLLATTRYDSGQWNAAIVDLNGAVVKQLTSGTGRHWWLGWS